jgi:hypothetical protein
MIYSKDILCDIGILVKRAILSGLEPHYNSEIEACAKEKLG